MNICIYGAASNAIDPYYIETVENVSKQLAKRGHHLLFGGGATGLMGAAARGFNLGGGRVCGVIPRDFESEGIEAIHDECDNIIWTMDMGTRKTIMEMNADAFIIAPGGIGTMDEFFQLMVLKDLHFLNRQVALFNIKNYYAPLMALMEAGTKEGFLRRKETPMFQVFTETETDAMMEYLEEQPAAVKGGILNNYKRDE